jgi:predicted amidohydrolase
MNLRSPTALILSSLLALSACGDDTDKQQPPSNKFNNFNNIDSADMSDQPDILFQQDMSTEFDMSPQDMSGEPDLSERPAYDPTLVELGPPPAQCVTPIISQPGPRHARIFTMSLRANLADAADHLTWRQRIHTLLWANVLPCLASDAPNVVVFPEAISLPMLLIGDKAAPARQRADSTSALAIMASTLVAPLAYYQSLYPEQPLPRLLLLAATDTLARATLDTFAQLADRYDLTIVVPVHAARWERVEQPDIAAQLADSDYAPSGSAWRAAEPLPRSVALVFGPDGALLQRAEKTHLGALEQRALALVPGQLDGVRVLPSPWGRTAVVLGESARMPSLQDRLDDLGAALILAPQSGPGRLAPQDPAAPWPSDLANMGAWNLVQRSPRARHAITAQLTGNLFELTFDGQVRLIEDAGPRAARLLGQSAALAGNLFVSPWVRPDPVEQDPMAPEQARRAALAQTSAALAAGSGDPLEGQYVEGVWALDLQRAPEADVETHPALISAGAYALLALSTGPVGGRKIALRKLAGEQQPLAQLAHPDYDLVRPQIVLDANGAVHLVAEAIGKRLQGANEGAMDNRLLYARLAADATSFEAVTLITPAGGFAYHPALALSQGTLHLAWTQQTGQVTRVVYAQGALTANAANPFERATPAQVNAQMEAVEQWDARLAVSGQRVAILWLERRDQSWRPMLATSQDAGLSWSAPTPLDDDEPRATYHSSPAICALPQGRLLVAWTHMVAGERSSAIAARLVSQAGSRMQLGPQHLIGQTDDLERWERSPALACATELSALTTARIAWVEQEQSRFSVHAAQLDTALDAVKVNTDAISAPGGAFGLRLMWPARGLPALAYESGGDKSAIVTARLND